MANHSNSSVANAKKWKIAFNSETKHATYYLWCAEEGRIKNNSKAKMGRASQFLDGVNVVNKKPVVVGNGEFSTTKTVGIINDGIAHSPIKEMADTSQRQRKIGVLARTILAICSYRHITNPHAYFVTLTVKNANLGQLKKAYLKLNRALSKMRKAVHHGKTRKSGLHLPALFGGEASWLGDFKSIETALNAESMENQDPNNTFHPHIHMMLITDKELDLINADSVLFDFWQAQFPNMHLSHDAFKIEKCYDKKQNAGRVTDGFIKGLTEACKYATKPDFYKRLPEIPTEFYKQVFAELYNSQYGMTLKRSSGICFDAQGFVNFNMENGLGNALMASHYINQSDDLNVPDFFTSRANFDDSNNYASFVNQHELSDKQKLYFNADLLKNAGFDSSIFDQIKFKDDDKSQLYRYLYEHLDFCSRGKSGLLSRLQRWLALAENQLRIAERSATNLHSRLAENSLSENFPTDKERDADALRNHWQFKVDDLKGLIEAVESNIDDNGLSSKFSDYRAMIKVNQVLAYMDDLGFDNLLYSDGTFDAYNDAGRRFVEKLRMVFGEKMLRGSCEENSIYNLETSLRAHIMPIWSRLYLDWKLMGKNDDFIWDDFVDRAYFTGSQSVVREDFYKWLIYLFPEADQTSQFSIDFDVSAEKLQDAINQI